MYPINKRTFFLFAPVTIYSNDDQHLVVSSVTLLLILLPLEINTPIRRNKPLVLALTFRKS